MIRIIRYVTLILWLLDPGTLLGQDVLSQTKEQVHALWEADESNDEDMEPMLDSLRAALIREGTACDLPELEGYWVQYLAMKGRNVESMELATKALRAHTQQQCGSNELLYLYRGMTTLYLYLEDWRIADSVAQLAIQLWDPQVHDSVTMSQLYFARGSCTNSVAVALPFYDSALAYAGPNVEADFHMSVLNNIGYSYAEEGRTDEAKPYFEEAFHLAKREKDYLLLGNAFNNLAFYKAGEERLQYTDSALYYASLAQDLASIESYTFNKAGVLYGMERYREAYDSLLSAYYAKTRLLGVERIRAIKEIEHRYQSERQAREIQQLKLDQLAMEVSELRLKRNQVALIIGSVALLFLMVFFALSYINTRRIKNKLAIKNAELDQERKRSDDLLLNILPAEVAQELKDTGESQARLYNNVTVLFADFVSFTVLGEHMSPADLVAEIHRQFTQFDHIMEKYGLEKIKTIGDAYLAVCGLPDQRKDHAERAILAAKELIRSTEQSNSKFKVRVGLNSGPVVAGIVGVKKYAYDIWGDTVNTAARMEENSQPGRINISKMTYDLVSHRFEFTHRGKVEAKHKGMVDMYFVGDELPS